MIVSIEATDRWYKLQYLKICHQSLVIGSFCIEYEENNVFFPIAWYRLCHAFQYNSVDVAEPYAIHLFRLTR